MSTPATPTAEGSSPAPATIAASAPDKALTSDIFTPDELAAIEAAGNGTLPAAKKPNDYAPAGVDAFAAPAPIPEAPKPDTPETPAVPESNLEEPTPEKLGKFRVQAKDFKEAELLRHMKTMSAEEAFAKVYGATKSAEPAKPAQDETPAKPVDADPAAALRDEIASLEAESDKAAEDLDTKQANRLNRQIVAKEAELRQIQVEAALSKKAAEQSKATEADTIFRQKETEAAKQVYALRPSLADSASAEHKEFTDFYRLKATDPDYAGIFESPRWPSIMYREFAEAKGWGKAVAPASAPALPAPTPGAPPLLAQPQPRFLRLAKLPVERQLSQPLNSWRPSTTWT
jgi:hypothetical protein